MNINKIFISGRLGADAELKYTPSGMAIGSFSIAQSKKDKDGNWLSSWFQVKLFQKTAEWNAPHLKKGCEVLIEGRVSVNSFTTREGVKKETYEIVADNVKVMAKLEKLDAPMTNNDLKQPQSPIQSNFTEDDMPF